MKKTVNALGDICPIPLVKAKEAIKELQGAGTVEVLVDNEIAVQNPVSYTHLCNTGNHEPEPGTVRCSSGDSECIRVCDGAVT